MITGPSAVVVFTDGTEKSPGIYLPKDGHRAKLFLAIALPVMIHGRVDRCAARFCGVCHEALVGNLSLGLIPTPAEDESVLYSEGSFYVDVLTWQVVHRMGRSVSRFQLDEKEVPRTYSRGQPAWHLLGTGWNPPAAQL